jgi:hypothetical protein
MAAKNLRCSKGWCVPKGGAFQRVVGDGTIKRGLQAHISLQRLSNQSSASVTARHRTLGRSSTGIAAEATE